MTVLITRRETILGAAAPLLTAVPADRPRCLFAYLALADHYGRSRWRHPILLLHKGEFLTGRLAACIGPATGEPLPVYALLFVDIQRVPFPLREQFARACAVDVCSVVDKAERRHRSDALHFAANGYAVNHRV
ncbi:hypothetical protein [Bradyrhizobium sp. UNPA324]|uniref:hypothetical protein n=1 Tax=Bradyrhizobium sp. UNPA324 TaxID=1141174 RepID=UPI001152B4CB|nr:hypothetical protein [Bradyrhizobium sp. UNPA324]